MRRLAASPESVRPAAEPSRLGNSMHAHEQFTVLCVDDNEDALLSLRLLLTLENYRVRESSSGGSTLLQLAGGATTMRSSS